MLLKSHVGRDELWTRSMCTILYLDEIYVAVLG